MEIYNLYDSQDSPKRDMERNEIVIYGEKMRELMENINTQKLVDENMMEFYDKDYK